MTASDIIQPTCVLAAIVFLLLCARPLIRRWGLGRATTSSPLIAVCATRMLDRTRRLTLVECDGGRLVVLSGGGQDVMMPWPSARSVAPAPAREEVSAQ